MHLTIYHATCWVLGLVAFVQLVLVGTALAVRGSQPMEAEIIERVVTEYVPIAPKQDSGAKAPLVPAWSAPAQVEPNRFVDVPVASTSNHTSFVRLRPAIKHPVVEVLVNEARAARVSDDLVLAITKLEEAQKTSPSEPNILYEFGEVAELLGNFDKAADYYEKVFQLGVTEAGVLYERAAEKLSVGFGAREQVRGKLSLGRVREFHDKRVVDGEKVVLTIPVLAAAGQVTDPDSIVVGVHVYDQLGEELVKASETNPPQSRWVSEPVDYRSGEEELRVTYFIPAVGMADERLFGVRKYFGHVVKLYYDDELVDQKAWPRILATEVNAPESDPLYLPDDYLPEDFNPDSPLLPPLPR